MDSKEDFIKKEKADIILGSVTAIPFPENYFDIILAVRSHYFWDDFDKAFAEIYRTLKQDGKMIIFSEQYKISIKKNMLIHIEKQLQAE